MFKTKVSEAARAAELEKMKEAFGENVAEVTEAPVREYMLKWLGAFVDDVDYYDAKAFCLPRRMYKNYLWNAFSFQKTDCYMDEDAEEAFGNGFEGECFVLLNTYDLLYTVPDGTVFNVENVKSFDNIIIFTKDYTDTYVFTGKADTGPYFKSAAATD